MAPATLLSSPRSPPPPPPPLQQWKKGQQAVYVAAMPLRAAPGPAQALVSSAYSLGLWDLQHFMVIIKPDPSLPQAVVFDFQPQDPENLCVALAALFHREVPGVVLRRTLRAMPKGRCWFVGFSNANCLDVANEFSKGWQTNLIVGKHDCRHYTNGLVERLIGERFMLEYLRGTPL